MRLSCKEKVHYSLAASLRKSGFDTQVFKSGERQPEISTQTGPIAGIGIIAAAQHKGRTSDAAVQDSFVNKQENEEADIPVRPISYIHDETEKSLFL